MDTLKAERRALNWLAISVACFLVSVWAAIRSSAPLYWLVPLGTFSNACVWFILWRDRRSSRLQSR